MRKEKINPKKYCIKNDKNINKNLWLGSYMDEDLFIRMQEIGYNKASTYLSQKNILEGIESATGKTFDSAGVVVLNKNKKILKVPHLNFSHKEGASDELAGYINIKYLNKLFSKISLKILVKKKFKDTNYSTVIIYEMRSACLCTVKYIKQHFPESNIVLIIPDLPQYMDMNMSKIKAFLKKLDWFSIKNKLKYIDKFVLYSKYMAPYLKINEKKWTVMEGSIDLKDVVEEECRNKVKAIMYSGVCDISYGIPILLEAFTGIKNEEYELWISGTGNAVNLINEYSKKDNRIKYFGFLGSREELLQKQKQAYMLINMRLPKEEASAYCFPSKIFEYMLSGNPVLSYKIKGIPDEYFKYLIKINDEKVETLMENIVSVFEMEDKDRVSLGLDGKSFVIKNKNSISQSKKLSKFIYGD